MLASCDVYESGSIEEAHVDCDELDKTTHDITDNTHTRHQALMIIGTKALALHLVQPLLN
jgi:hypothetical protein